MPVIIAGFPCFIIYEYPIETGNHSTCGAKPDNSYGKLSETCRNMRPECRPGDIDDEDGNQKYQIHVTAKTKMRTGISMSASGDDGAESVSCGRPAASVVAPLSFAIESGVLGRLWVDGSGICEPDAGESSDGCVASLAIVFYTSKRIIAGIFPLKIRGMSKLT
jgi:hypothetical protein